MVGGVFSVVGLGLSGLPWGGGVGGVGDGGDAVRQGALDQTLHPGPGPGHADQTRKSDKRDRERESERRESERRESQGGDKESETDRQTDRQSEGDKRWTDGKRQKETLQDLDSHRGHR